MDTWVWHQVGLELGQIDVQGTVESQRGSDRADNLTDQTIQVGVGWALDIQITTANVVDGLVVDHEGTIRVLEGGVGGQDGVVWLNHSCGDLRSWVDSKLQLGLLTIIDTQTFHQQGSESGAGTSTEAVEDEETLKTSALISQLANSVEYKIDNFFANGVVATSVVVGGIFFASDQLFWMEQLTVCASAHLIDYGWLQVDEDCSWNVLASSSLTEESVERVITASDGLVTRHLTVRLDTVLQAVQLPAGIAHLDSGLADMYTDALSHVGVFCWLFETSC
jgi:hypothetical protein